MPRQDSPPRPAVCQCSEWNVCSSLYPLAAEVAGANEAIQHGKDLRFHQEENIPYGQLSAKLPVTWSLGHLVTWSLGHSMTRSPSQFIIIQHCD